MKKTLVVGLALGLALVAGNAFAGSGAGTGIVNSAHDLGNDAATKDTDGKICVFCHTPHYSQKPGGATLAYSPLWNKDLSSYTNAFTLYNNGTMMTAPTTGISDARHFLNANLQQPTRVSLLCLSCHDGSVALNAYGNDQSNPVTGYQAAGTYRITDDATWNTTGKVIGRNGDLSDHHPIGFDYGEVVLADMEIAPEGTEMVNGMTIGDLLSTDGYMTCATCHDVHNTQNTGTKFVWRTNARSEFCLVCHLKGAQDGTAGGSTFAGTTSGPR